MSDKIYYFSWSDLVKLMLTILDRLNDFVRICKQLAIGVGLQNFYQLGLKNEQKWSDFSTPNPRVNPSKRAYKLTRLTPL